MEQHLTLRLVLAAAFTLFAAPAFAQCTGVFPANTLCGNLSGSPAPPSAFAASTLVGPGSSTLNGLPLWANTTGSLLKDGAGQTVAGNYTWSGTQTYSNTQTFNALVNFTSTFQIGGNTMTFPGVAATLAGLAVSQTFSGNNIFTGNNTFSTGTDNFTGTFQIGGTTVTLPISVPNGGTGNATATAHSIPINEGTAAQTNTGTGTAGQALVSNGASADPTFQSGGWVLLNTLVASNSATLQDTTSLTSNYTEYELEFINIVPATNTVNFELQWQSGGSFQTTSYVTSTTNNCGSVTVNNFAPTTFIPLTGGNALANTAITWGYSGNVRFGAPSNSVIGKPVWGTMSYSGGTTSCNGYISGGWNSTAAITGFQVLMSSGNISAGTVKVYGRN